MPTISTAIGILIACWALWALVTLPRAWRQGPDPRMPPIWFQSRAVYMAGRRSCLVGEIGLVALVVAFNFPGTVLVSGGIFFASAIPMASIYLFNRPRFLVPPKLRDERGVLTDYLVRRKARDSSGSSEV